MRIRIGFEIALQCDAHTPLLLALMPRPEEEPRLIEPNVINADPYVPLTSFIDEYGNRRTRLVAEAGQLTLRYDSVAKDSGKYDEVALDAYEHPVEDLPADVLRFLSPSRYCQSDLLVNDAWRLFGQSQPGWARVQAICDFVHAHIEFGYHHANPAKTALDVFRDGRGVCRDFAHLAVALTRAMNIPARYCSGYLGDIGVPPAGAGDFCAWFEAYLGGRWYTFDARYNTPRIGRILMVRGRDAADTAMVTSFGNVQVASFKVWCDEVSAGSALADEAPLVPAAPGVAGTYRELPGGWPLMFERSSVPEQLMAADPVQS